MDSGGLSMLDDDKCKAFMDDVDDTIKALAFRSAEKRQRVACDTIMATVWTVMAVLDGKPGALCASEEVRKAVDDLLNATAKLNEAVQKVVKEV